MLLRGQASEELEGVIVETAGVNLDKRLLVPVPSLRCLNLGILWEISLSRWGALLSAGGLMGGYIYC